MTIREQKLLSLTLSKALFFPFLLPFILKSNNCYISLILGYIFGILLIYLFSKIKYNIIYKGYLFIISLLLLIFSIYLITIQTSMFYLKETSFIFVILLYLFVIIYGSSKKIKGLVRLNEILTPLSIILIIFAFICNIKNFNYNYLLLNSFDININLIYNILIVGIFTSLPIILFLYLYDDYNIKAIYKGYLINFLLSFLMLISTLSTLGINLSKYFTFPFYIALKKIQLLNFIERIENIIVIFSFIDITILSIFLLNVIKKILKIKKEKL